MQASLPIAAPGETLASTAGCVAPGETPDDGRHARAMTAGVLSLLGEKGQLPGMAWDSAAWSWNWFPEFLPLQGIMERGWGDTPEAVAARDTWPVFHPAPEERWVEAAAGLARVPPAVVRLAARMGIVWFTDALGGPVLVLRSDCGRRAEGFRLDGSLFVLASGFSPWMAFPGSLETVPFGWRSLLPEVPWVVVAGPGLGYLAMLGLLAECGAGDGALLAVSSPDFPLCREVVKALRFRRVRFFLPTSPAWTEAAARWGAALEAAGCRVDAFRFEEFNVRDAAGFALLPAECKEAAPLIPTP